MDYGWIAILVLLVAEMILSATWNDMYFKKGIPVFLYRISTYNPIQILPSAEELTERFSQGWLSTFIFKALSLREIAFREKILELKLFHYSPVMHGLIYIEPQGREVRVIGFMNWWIILFAYIAFNIARSVPDTRYFFSFGFIGILDFIYSIQRFRYRKIGEAIKEKKEIGV